MIKNVFKGVNLYKWALLALFYLASVGGAFYYGKYTERLDQAEQAAVAAEAAAEAVVNHVNERLPLIQKDDDDAAQLRAELRGLRGKLNEAITQAGNRPECALSADELRYFQELDARTR